MKNTVDIRLLTKKQNHYFIATAISSVLGSTFSVISFVKLLLSPPLMVFADYITANWFFCAATLFFVTLFFIFMSKYQKAQNKIKDILFNNQKN